MAGKGKSFFANLSPSGRAEKAARVDGDPRATMADLLKAPKDTAEIYLPPRVGNITAVICKGKVFTAIDKTLADYVPALKASTGSLNNVSPNRPVRVPLSFTSVSNSSWNRLNSRLMSRLSRLS